MKIQGVSLIGSLLLLLAVFSLAGCAATRGYDRGGYGDDSYGYDRGECYMCGVVQDIDRVRYRTDRQDTATLGTILGVVIGAAAGNQIGDGSGQKIATVAGAIAGGVAGHEIDQANDVQEAWRIRVRLDDGRYATVTQEDNPRVRVGDYVVVRDEHVYAR